MDLNLKFYCENENLDNNDDDYEDECEGFDC